MKSLKELSAKVLTKRKLEPEEESIVLAVTDFMCNENSYYMIENGKLEHWYKEIDGTITREFVNDVLCKETEGSITKEYYDNGVCKETKTYPNGNNQYEMWLNSSGFLHKEDVPAEITWYENGIKESENWYFNGAYHRDRSGENSGPATAEWYENGNKKWEGWYKHDESYRKDGPASSGWHENGNKSYESWYKEGWTVGQVPFPKRWDENGNLLSASEL